ncbi:MAG TPA: sugar transferase [Gemmatimonadota bacterium]|nr:sugar transferase [Gemmatimonadota bacterium]
MRGSTGNAAAGRSGRHDHRNGLTALRLGADVLAGAFAFWVAYNVYLFAIGAGWVLRPPPQPGAYVAIAIVFCAIVVCVFVQQGLYRGRATVLNLWELETAVKGVVLSAALLFALLFFLDLNLYSRYVVVGSLTLAAIFVVLERRAISAFVRTLQLRGATGRRILIYGCGRTGQLLMKKILESPHLGAVVIGFLDDHVPLGSYICCRITQTDPTLFKAPLLGRLEDLEELNTKLSVDELLVAEPSLPSERQLEILQLCDQLGIDVGVVPSLGDIRSDQLRVEDLSAIPVLRPIRPVTRRIGLVAKRVFDVVASAALLLATSPLWLASALAIRLEDGVPVIFAQQRVGKDGQAFRVLKFRTMRGDAPPYASSPPGDRDTRITRTGRFLRKTGLDELPQLINVMRGEMSLVGPRPEMPHLVQQYSSVERQRLRVKPGITGLWQLSADRHAEIHENVEYDLYYVTHQSFLLDMLILMETLFFTLGVVFGTLDRRTAPAAEKMPAGAEKHLPAMGDEYILLALDQRRNGSLPRSWRACVPAVFEVSDRWPVRVVLAEGNRETFESLIEETVARVGRDGRQTSYAPYRSRSELRRMVLEARLVITDLEHVGRWTEEAGVDLLLADDGGAQWWPRSRVPDPIVSELSRHMTVYVGPSPQEAEGPAEAPLISLTG